MDLEQSRGGVLKAGYKAGSQHWASSSNQLGLVLVAVAGVQVFLPPLKGALKPDWFLEVAPTGWLASSFGRAVSRVKVTSAV